VNKAWLLFDAHQDLAWNALTFGREYTRSAYETRRIEHETGSIAPQVNGDTLLGWPEYQQGRVAIALATLFAAPERRRGGPWDTQVYATPEEAARVYQGQLAYYQRWTEAHPDHWRLLLNADAVRAHWQRWQTEDGPHPVGLILLMEGAEAIQTLDDLPWWREQGLRIIGPAWAGTRFCGGTGEPGPLTDEGRALLRAMAELGFILDLSHMDVTAAREALDLYDGPIVATHANPQAVARRPSNRFLPDDVIRGLLARDGVIGIVPYNRFLVPDWEPGMPKERVTLDAVVAHIDYIAQMAGDARHVALGTDFDGGFGVQSVPAEIDTIADLPRLADRLARLGYTEADIRAVFGENWLRIFAA